MLARIVIRWRRAAAVLALVGLVACGGGGGSTGGGEAVGDTTGDTGGNPTPAVSVSVSPATVTLQAGGQQQFTSDVTGTTNTAVNWTADGGTVSTTGLYTAPSAAGTYHVTATSQVDVTKTGSAKVTVTAPVFPKQSGSSGDEEGRGLAFGAMGDAFITGITGGSLGGNNAGGDDVFIGRYDADGAAVWVRQLGTTGNDRAFAIALDGSGNVLVTGYTRGDLGRPNAGFDDAFLAKYDATGSQLWLTQFGTVSRDFALSVAVDGAGNAYVAGDTGGALGNVAFAMGDAFVAKFDPDGNNLWVQQFGTFAVDGGVAVVVDGSSNVFVTGQTRGDVGGPNAGDYDVFLAKYSAAGSRLWLKQFGTTGEDLASGVAVDGSGNVVVCGTTRGSLGGDFAGGYSDAFVAKYDTSGNQVWVRQFGTWLADFGHGITTDAVGEIVVTGSTEGNLDGTNPSEWTDAFVAKYDAAGNFVWVRQWGTTLPDAAYAVAVDGSRRALVTGMTGGSFAGASAGGNDVFLARYDSSGNPG